MSIVVQGIHKIPSSPYYRKGTQWFKVFKVSKVYKENLLDNNAYNSKDNDNKGRPILFTLFLACSHFLAVISMHFLNQPLVQSYHIINKSVGLSVWVIFITIKNRKIIAKLQLVSLGSKKRCVFYYNSCIIAITSSRKSGGICCT